MFVIIKFIFLASLIFVLGFFLSKYADILSERKKIDKSLMGLFLLGIVTSIPELITTINSVLLVDSPDMAVGNVLGSNLINMIIGSLIGILVIKWSISNLNFYMGQVSVVLSLVIFSAVVGIFDFSWVNFNYVSPTVFVLYFAFLWFLKYMKKENHESNPEVYEQTEKQDLKKVYLILAGLSIGVMITGTFFVVVCDELSKTFGFSSSFVGIFFMAFATSLPELVVTFSSINLGSYKMALGNVLGSNSFNILIIAIADFITKKPIVFSKLDVKTFSITIILTIFIMALNFNIAIIENGKKKRNIPLSLFGLLTYLLYLFLIPKT